MLAAFLLAAWAPAFAQWEVTDEQTHQGISDLQTDINNRLDKIYKQSNVTGETYNPDTHKSLTLQFDDSSGGNGQQDISGQREVAKITSESLNKILADRCPEQSSNPKQSLQQPVCKDIVERESRLQNYMIDMLSLMRDRQQELKAILQERQNIESGGEHEMGQIQSNTNRLLALQAQLQIDESNYKLTIASYDRYLSAQRARLADYAKKLSNGDKSNPAGALASAAILEAALQLAPTVGNLIGSF
ncbi:MULTISPECIES: hypothetical protein [Pseudoxanthomonas]|uniref:Uncharacterized protein n=1 Tax=Pseudoxanthomonas winnipegensis TaxID=2480810 RepID=A0A4V2HDM5_9GAMM|nr:MULTISPECIES: hypothetical protein [Pseudoxanthomonas]TAA28285.1 hypothetical protein EA660_01460 [Pseudoxanthomonas winnipegensis]TMN24904.1 hypothetical protein FF950_03840 [Pseudoxanthomonas sp. X-1]UAY73682.1 hypothetical protein LAJ50_14485 [Pseudoxanthomonas sp. X-1]